MIPKILEALVILIDCMIVESPGFNTTLIGPSYIGSLDYIIEFAVKISTSSQQFITLVNKIHILLNLHQENSLL